MNMKKKKIHIGIGFVTGRKNFKNVVSSYISSWNEAGMLDKNKYALHLFVAYDLKYLGTHASDYQITEKETLDSVESAYYLSNSFIASEARMLTDNKVITVKEAKLLFGEGYAMKRNAVLFFALKQKMDCLIFLDDDEYPMANIQIQENELVWKGQEVLSTHIQNLGYADMTHGHHCGYVSPIPHFEFNENLSKNDFKTFIKTISNDIINWESIEKKMDDGGITYANPDIILKKEVEIVKEINGMKFISGANLGFNLKNPDKLFPFYNPPGARGEDTFLSTCIEMCNIRKVPCYTFHDGYSVYQRLLIGALPNKLKSMDVRSPAIYKRFFKAAVGWVRYKPLLLYITKKEHYEDEIKEMKENLQSVMPKLCAFFGNDDFKVLFKELDFYHTQVEKHFHDFELTKEAWSKVICFLSKGGR